MEKRYQVFVSSTFRDLEDERQEVIQALLELDCIPAGMELFPAANDDQWTLIKKVIDDCDYYLVIIAGRYGSVGSAGKSYTEMEYRYAVEQGKPVMAFLHKDPNALPLGRCEAEQEGRSKLEAFRKHAEEKMCRYWDSPADLGSQVSRSLVKLTKTHPGIGWVRGDLVPDVPAAEEILRLRKTIEELNDKLSAARTEAPEGTSVFAQGDDPFTVRFGFEAYLPSTMQRLTGSWQISQSWNDIFASISPKLIDELPESAFKRAIDAFVEESAKDGLAQQKQLLGRTFDRFDAEDADFQTIKVQLRALGLIAQSEKPRSVKDTGTYWTLTPYGNTIMTRLRAILKSSVQPESPKTE